ncbi:MAG TPA: hypothetical protein VHF46_00220 [Rubrobacteraceae bacterium]|nr:hypothetical protein [Rubrobacteraceae bacterium]
MVRNTLIGYGALILLIILMELMGVRGGQQVAVVGGQSQNSQLFATDPFRLEPGLAVVKMNHRGEGGFVVNLLSANQEEAAATPERLVFSEDQSGGSTTEVATALAEEIGPVTVSRAVNVPFGGKHLLDVKADAPWTVEIEQPRPSSAPRLTSFSGDDDTATPFFSLSKGSKQVYMTNPLEGKLAVSLLDTDGRAVRANLTSEAEQPGQGSPDTISTTVDVPESGIYLFNVRADGLWTIEISDAEHPDEAE